MEIVKEEKGLSGEVIKGMRRKLISWEAKYFGGKL